MKDTTLLFLVKREEGVIADICLAMKKRGFGAGRYNGVGGKVEEGETVEQAVKREAKEEIGVSVGVITKSAELTFIFIHKEDWNQLVQVYMTEDWQGDIVETEEMKPEWFKVQDIPYKDMWPDDIFWVPSILEDKKVKAKFSFEEGDTIIEQRVTEVEEF